MKRQTRQTVLLLVLVLLAVGVWQFWPMLTAYVGGPAWSGGEPPTPAERARWAQKLQREGLENFHRVTEDLYRGAQPTGEGMRQLRAMGIRTVVNLREFHSDSDELGGTGLAGVEIPMNAWRVDEEDILRFLRVVGDRSNLPVFVHCQHGSDRTGTMCAAYRVVMCGWSKQEAIREMTAGGFGFHDVFKNLPETIGQLDVEDLKRRVKEASPSTGPGPPPRGTGSTR